jgi:hypothetical protein
MDGKIDGKYRVGYNSYKSTEGGCNGERINRRNCHL